MARESLPSSTTVDRNPLALGATNGIAGVLVEACQQRFVVGKLHDPSLPDLERVGRVSQPSQRRGPRRPLGDPGLELDGNRTVLTRRDAQADPQGANALRRLRRVPVEHRAVRHVPEGSAGDERTLLRRHEGDDRVVVGEHVATLRLAVEGGDIGPGPVVQEVA